MYIENPNKWKTKKTKQKLLELINNYRKLSGYKINIQKSITFLYTTSEYVEFEIKSTILSTFSTPTKEILSITPTKCVQDLYEENYKILRIEIKEELNKWRVTQCEQEDSILSRFQFFPI